MSAFLDAHPRGRFGAVLYDLDQFAIDPSERRTALAPYSARFALPPE
jgi:hypothetical protein